MEAIQNTRAILAILVSRGDAKTGQDVVRSAGVRARRVALSLLRSGIGKGLISRQERNGFPKNIWAVDEHDFAFEAQLENLAAGVYHGYPLPSADPFSVEVMRLWKERP